MSMVKVVMGFAGTGASKEHPQIYGETEGSMSDTVVRIYFSGCQDKRIGGAQYLHGIINPNLDTVPNAIMPAFTCTTKEEEGEKKVLLSLVTLKTLFGDAIDIFPQPIQDEEIEVDSFVLHGFSRGAVTTFAMARKLNELNIPMDLYAQDPVSGDSHENTANESSEFFKNKDLSQCHNLKSAEITVGTYQKNKGGTYLDNTFYRQMIPIFSKKTDLKIYSTPKTAHLGYSPLERKNFQKFLISMSVQNKRVLYTSQSPLRLYPVPRVLQQRNHIGTMGRVEFLPDYKNKIQKTLNDRDDIVQVSDKTDLKSAQMLMALIARYPKGEIPEELLTLRENKNQASKDFIVEVHAIITSYFDEIPPPKKPLRLTNPTEPQKKAFNTQMKSYAFNLNKNKETVTACLKKTDALLISFLTLKKPVSIDEKKTFSNEIIKALEGLKTVNSAFHKKAITSVTSYLKEASIIQPALEQYLEQSETLGKSVTKTDENGEFIHKEALDKMHPKNITELTSRLYHTSTKIRAYVYQANKALLPQIETPKDVADLALFSTTSQFKALLANSNDVIKDFDSLFEIITQLPAKTHRKILCEFPQALSILSFATPEQILSLTTYLPSQEASHLNLQLSKLKPSADNEGRMYAQMSRLLVRIPRVEHRPAAQTEHQAPTSKEALDVKASTKTAPRKQEEDDDDDENKDPLRVSIR